MKINKTISIIICSRKGRDAENYRKDLLVQGNENVEIIVIDNFDNQYSIFSAYNEGVKRAKNDILCFVHDDVYMHTKDWIELVFYYFNEDDNLGCIGIAGGHFLPKTISPWWYGLRSGGCLQTYKNNTLDDRDLSHFKNVTIIPAVAVDGVWMCVKRTLFEENMIRFDDKTFDGFHCYDIDICLQVRAQHYKVCVVSDILLEHLSYGNINMAWHISSKKLYDKWCNCLPQVDGIGFTDDFIDYATYLIENLVNSNYSLCEYSNELHKIQSSHAYRIGKIIVKPFAWIKGKLNRNRKE